MIGKLLTGALLVLTVPALAAVTALSVGTSTQRCLPSSSQSPTPEATFTAEALVPDSGPTNPPGPASGACVPDLGTSPTPAAIPAGTPADVSAAVRTGLAYVGVTSGWYQRCDQLACRAYGYANSGYVSAHTHWLAMLATGHAHPGDPCPPLGSFVFFNTGRPDGHVSLVVQADPGRCDPNAIHVTANEIFDHATGNHGGVYQLSLARLEAMYLGGHGYLGWSDPVCAGAFIPAGARVVPAGS
ncbi:hypothetical protein CELL_02909 [Cellulomonas sp. T2.31MG-18]|uniref:hypothetical protein n=1 Tax=Cellulomonas sp. T2.31MG-18 TaxID=3157619 RepID=UPI0035E97E06